MPVTDKIIRTVFQMIKIQIQFPVQFSNSKISKCFVWEMIADALKVYKYRIYIVQVTSWDFRPVGGAKSLGCQIRGQ